MNPVRRSRGRTVPRVGQRDYELLDGMVVIVDGERIPNETVSLIVDDAL